MKNWVRFIADDDADKSDPFKAHVPFTQIEAILTSKDHISFRLVNGGLLRVEGDGAENLIDDLLKNGEPLLVKGEQGITSVKLERYALGRRNQTLFGE